MEYLNSEGMFTTTAAKTDAGKLSARPFFEKYGASIPDFACVALHLTSKSCDSDDVKRPNKVTKFIYSLARNRMGPAKREKLLVRYTTLQQRYGKLAPGEVPPPLRRSVL